MIKIKHTLKVLNFECFPNVGNVDIGKSILKISIRQRLKYSKRYINDGGFETNLPIKESGLDVLTFLAKSGWVESDGPVNG